MTRYRVTLYNTILETMYIEAKDGDEAAQKAWSQPSGLELPTGFSLSDPSAWELDDVQEDAE